MPKLPGYYDKPEGEDIVGKLIAVNKHAFAIGSVVGLYDVGMYSKHLKGLQPNVGRYLYYVGPFVGMASVFTTVVYASTKVRGKDDTWNYTLGAYAAGGIFGAWKRSGFWGWTIGSAFALAGILKKMSLEQGWHFFVHDINPNYGDFRDLKRDYSLFGEGEKNWVPGKKTEAN